MRGAHTLAVRAGTGKRGLVNSTEAANLCRRPGRTTPGAQKLWPQRARLSLYSDFLLNTPQHTAEVSLI